MKKSITLEQVKKIKTKAGKYGVLSKSDLELSVAWAKGEIKGYQLCEIWGMKNGGRLVNKLLASLREYIRVN